jgi:hypothetical protein
MASAGLPTGPDIPDWEPPQSVEDRLAALEAGGGGGAGSGWTLLEEVTVGAGGALQVEFADIDQDYFELQIEVWIRTDIEGIFDYVGMRINDDDDDAHYGLASVYTNPGTSGGGGFASIGASGTGAATAPSPADGGLIVAYSTGTEAEAGWFGHSTTSIKRYAEPIRHSMQTQQHYIDNLLGSWNNGPEFFFTASFWYPDDPITDLLITPTGKGDTPEPVIGSKFIEGSYFRLSAR